MDDHAKMLLYIYVGQLKENKYLTHLILLIEFEVKADLQNLRNADNIFLLGVIYGKLIGVLRIGTYLDILM